MDEPLVTPPIARFAPDRRYTAAAALGVLVAVVLGVVGGDPAGRLLAAVAALVLVAYVIADVAFSPRLVVSGEGVVIRSPLTRATLTWGEVDDVRAESRSRLGLRSTTLEIDAGPVLAVLSRRALGADPAEVADLVRAFRPQ
ncbi:MAG: hypothetical protein QOG01_3051 [Pseudonocardiales bacterium]|nr:hypothetical protein [Pseudonocardiales bacterium]